MAQGTLIVLQGYLCANLCDAKELSTPPLHRMAKTTKTKAEKKAQKTTKRYYSSLNSFNRNLAAQQSMRDRATFCVNYSDKIQFTFAGNTGEVTKMIPFWEYLKRSNFWPNIGQTFDQIQIRGIYFKLTPLFPNSFNKEGTQSTEYIYAFDRNGVCYGNSSINYKEIATYGSAKSSVMNSSTKNIIHGKIVATDYQEKTQFIDTEILQGLSRYSAFDGNNITLGVFMTFNPWLLVGYKIPLNQNNEYPPANYTLDANLEIKYYVTCRGTKNYGVA